MKMMEQYKKIDKNKLLLSPSGAKQQTRVSNLQGNQNMDFEDGFSEYSKGGRISSSTSQLAQSRKLPSSSHEQSIRSVITNESLSSSNKRSSPSKTQISQQVSQMLQQNPQIKQHAEQYHTKGYQARK